MSVARIKQRFALRLEKEFTCVNGGVGLKSAYINKTALEGRGHLIVENAGVRDSGGGHYLEVRFNSKVAPDQAQLFPDRRAGGKIINWFLTDVICGLKANLSLATNVL